MCRIFRHLSFDFDVICSIIGLSDMFRLEEQCETSVVSEPVKVCTAGQAHKVNIDNCDDFGE